MATKVSVPAFRGVLIPAAMCGWDNLAARGSTSADSYYTSADPGPGGMTPDDPSSTFRAEISNAQDRDVVTVVRQGGFPGWDVPNAYAGFSWREPCRIAYKYPEDTVTDGGEDPGPAGDGALRGHDTPSIARGYKHLDTHGGGAPEAPQACVIPSTQAVVVASVDQTAKRIKVVSWDPYTDTAGSTVTISTFTSTNVAAIVCLPGSERLIIYAKTELYHETAFYSDDHGATWDLFGVDVLPVGVPTSIVRRVAVASPVTGDVGLWLFTATAAYQYVSTDGGSTFTSLGNSTVASTTWPGDVCVTPTGRVILLRPVNGASDYPAVVVMASPGDAVSASTPATLYNTTWDAGHIVADPDGTLWIIGVPNGGGPAILWVSYDDGTSWEHCMHGPYGAGTVTPGLGRLVPAAGAVHMAHGIYLGPTGSRVISTYGGWSNIVAGEDLDAATAYAVDSRRIGYGEHNTPGASAAESLSWFAWALPDGMGWTAFGAGTVTLASNADNADLKLVDSRTYTLTHGATKYGHGCHVICTATAGGSLAALQCGPLLRIGDGTIDHEVSVRIKGSTGQAQAFDEAAGTSLGSIYAFTPGAMIEFFIGMRQFTTTGDHAVEVYARVLGSKVWQQIGYSENGLTNGGGLGASSFRWGNHTAGPTSLWRFAASYSCANTGSAYEWRVWRGSPCRDYTAGSEADSGHWPVIGRRMPAAPVPLGDHSTDPYASPATALTGAPFVRGVGGPARFGERFTNTTAHGYGADRLFPEVYPSPADTWKSYGVAAEVTDLYFTWTETLARTLGSWSVGLMLTGINFRYAYLQEWTGAAWATIGTFDAAIANSGSLKWTRTGSMIEVTATSPAGGRFFGDGELVGGTFAEGDAFRIAENTAGVWSDATTMRLTLRLEGDTSILAGSGTSGEIWSPGGVLIAHKQETPRTRYRVYLPQQLTVGNDYKIAKMLPGAFVPFGRQWSDGWAFDQDPNITTSTDARGTDYADAKGEPIRTWTVAWTDAILTRGMATVDPEPNYLATSSASAGKALAARNDVASQLQGIMRRLQGKTCVLLRSVPTSDAAAAMITDRDLWLYSRIGALRVEHIAGPEELGGWAAGAPGVRPAGQVLRVAQIPFREVV